MYRRKIFARRGTASLNFSHEKTPSPMAQTTASSAIHSDERVALTHFSAPQSYGGGDGALIPLKRQSIRRKNKFLDQQVVSYHDCLAVFANKT
jgi:hypothetical protein